MSPNLRIALRFLTAKRRAMIMSLSCIVLGVGLFLVTQATTSGFEQFFIRTILGTNGAIRIEDKIQDTLRSMEAALALYPTMPGGAEALRRLRRAADGEAL
jgi:lipoprotein-releasing system permease protein